MSFTLHKVTNPKETTKTVYVTDDSPFSSIGDIMPKIEPKLLQPITKEEAQTVWGTSGLLAKREIILKILNDKPMFSSQKSLDYLFKIKTSSKLDEFFTNLFFFSEEKARKHNEKEMKRVDPLHFAD